MSKLAKNILAKIKKEKIFPRAKWLFMLKNLSLHLAFVLAILLGAVGFAVILTAISSSDFDFFQRKIPVLFKLLPAFWILFLVTFLAFAIFNFRKTKGGHRVNFFVLLLGNFAASIFVGSLIFASFGPGRIGNLENHFAKRMHMKGLHEREISRWQNPENGFLAGKILRVENERIFVLQDFSKQVWQVDFARAKKMHFVKVTPNEKVKMRGEKNSENSFTAAMLAPLGPPPNHRPPWIEF